ncbi:metal-dependent amidase/aminoacylase/carboxypeptidase [Aspergillus sclerotiicarbonarius CBS 121057]|uniref:Metal-dependent amidase/aminoacylase/carboxypeptidase n=1 Tax=Aspergillus sclerotiicarbonarius (strain CBS 121057 / IBT 28362) TaxID=1448318 RepID=A0A319E0B8_ASPSB|nr:metal-dependent amidase/aminoacylase/carboxypeptidase [Aspergillus sclerotiicarbonarius CBS 121057]
MQMKLANKLGDILEEFRPNLTRFESLYRHIHSHPELSFCEEETSTIAAEHLREVGFEVHTHIGGYGVAGVLRNGDGPTVLLRADMDALPVQEKTGLPYASTKTAKNKDGVEVPVMHACGHDTHVVSLMASASLLHSAREHWSGTLICLFQPAEELVSGARAMLDDGLYDKIPHPEVVLAQHVMPMKAGTVGVISGRLLTAADSFNVRIFGKGGHGSAPEVCIDPVVTGASIIMKLQTIVGRQVPPGKLAVVTCGYIQAGHAGNVIPDTLDLKLDVRTCDDSIRERVVGSVKRIIRAECESAGCEKEPQIDHVSSTPATINDDATVQTLRNAFGSYFQDRFVETSPANASEDFSLLARAVNAPYVMWTYGGVDPQTWDDAVKNDTVKDLPSNHSPYFAPVIEPTLQTAVDAMSIGALTFLKRQ